MKYLSVVSIIGWLILYTATMSATIDHRHNARMPRPGSFDLDVQSHVGYNFPNLAVSANVGLLVSEGIVSGHAKHHMFRFLDDIQVAIATETYWAPKTLKLFFLEPAAQNPSGYRPAADYFIERLTLFASKSHGPVDYTASFWGIRSTSRGFFELEPDVTALVRHGQTSLGLGFGADWHGSEHLYLSYHARIPIWRFDHLQSRSRIWQINTFAIRDRIAFDHRIWLTWKIDDFETRLGLEADGLAIARPIANIAWRI